MIKTREEYLHRLKQAMMTVCNKRGYLIFTYPINSPTKPPRIVKELGLRDEGEYVAITSTPQEFRIVSRTDASDYMTQRQMINREMGISDSIVIEPGFDYYRAYTD